MKAWRFYDFGDMRLEEVPNPKVKSNWVLCKIRRVQPSITDVQRALGIQTLGYEEMEKMLRKHSPLQLLGHEMSAEVIEVGKDVESLKVGDIVCTSGHISCGHCHWCLAGEENYCINKVNIGITIPGAFAEMISLPENALIKPPESLDDASIVCLQPLSTVVAAIRDAQMTPGQTVAITGQGVMGLYMLQAVNINGASKVYTTDIREDTLKLSRKFNASEAIDASKIDPVKKISDLTKGKGVDIVFECAGGNPQQGLAGHTTLHQAFEMVRPGGKVVQVAALVGDLKINSNILRTKGIKWISLGGHGNKTIQLGADWVANGRIDLKTLVSHEITGLENLPEAFEITQNKEKYGATNPCQIIVL